MTTPAQAAPAHAARWLDEGTALRISFVIALVATLGSLFASEVLGHPPCLLCWYQRIAMYPLTLIFFVALWSGDRSHALYSIPLAALGLAIAGYHNLIYYGVIPEAITPCQQGVSCAARQVELLGFITVPLMSLAAFLCIGALGVVTLDRKKGS
jgi:disulfide bond formation protein DsbB